jgi:hypothetical protein
MPIMTITPWCSPIERPGLLARETGTRKFVTRVQSMLNSAAIARPLRVSEMYRDPRRMDDAAERKPDFTTLGTRHSALGTRTTSAANAGLIVGTTPIAILVLAALAAHERLTARRAAGFPGV